ncbi:MAG: hypothetical protein ACI9BC_001918, partial [Crocinitomicaceae bacterium]
MQLTQYFVPQMRLSIKRFRNSRPVTSLPTIAPSCRRLAIMMVGLFAPIMASIAQAELRIEVTKGVDNAVRVAVVPFEWRGQRALPENISDTVTSDLVLSGRFESLPINQMLSLP